ncbi:MAG: hypothetical protein RR630_10750 [Coprobacillus sp.]
MKNILSIIEKLFENRRLVTGGYIIAIGLIVFVLVYIPFRKVMNNEATT